MRKQLIMLWLAAATLICASASASAQTYYSNGYWFGGGWYGPYRDCNGSRCYLGPPYVYRRYQGRRVYVPTPYYYGYGGGYYHGY